MLLGIYHWKKQGQKNIVCINNITPIPIKKHWKRSTLRCNPSMFGASNPSNTCWLVKIIFPKCQVRGKKTRFNTYLIAWCSHITMGMCHHSRSCFWARVPICHVQLRVKVGLHHNICLSHHFFRRFFGSLGLETPNIDMCTCFCCYFSITE